MHEILAKKRFHLLLYRTSSQSDLLAGVEEEEEEGRLALAS
jgi:hypothetical protein